MDPLKAGYIKLWRKSLDSGLMQNPKLWTFWCWCLLKATHKPIKQLVGFQEVHLQPGQFVFGRAAASRELGMSEKSIRTCVLHLKKLEKAAIKTASKYSIITIINWDTYQGGDEEKGQQVGQVGASKGPAKGHKQEVKNVRMKEYNKKNTKDDFTLPDWIDPQLWQDFVDHRKQIKKPMTKRAMELATKKLAELEKAGQDHRTSIEHAILNGWQGFYPVGNNKGNNNPRQQEEYYQGYKRI